ncbi:MAG: UDP-glucose 4-epimerase GalE [Myxococcota bacterium]
MRLLVTGGAGYVGGFTARRLAAAGHDVVVIDDLSKGHAPAAPAGSLVVCDIADRARVAELLRARRIEAVLHFAASASVPESVREPERYRRNNVLGTAALLDAMRDARVERLVFSSTCAVYGSSSAPALTEDLPLAPESPYAETKLAAEGHIADHARRFGLRRVILRYFNAAGASPDGAHGEHHDPESHLIPLVLQTLLGRRDALVVYGSDFPTPDGTCVRDYVHVDDLADAHVRALAWSADAAPGAGLVLNLGSGVGSSVMEVIRAAERVTGRPVPQTLGPRRAGDPPRLVARADAARRALGWEARSSSIDAIVGSAWEWHRRHPDGYAGE